MKNDKSNYKLLQRNKKAYFDYEVVEDLECGIALVGTEEIGRASCRERV